MRKLLIILLMTAAALTPARAQWTEPVRIGPPGEYIYPQVLATGDTIHVVGTLLLGGDKVVYLRSEDAGDSWGQSHVLSDTINSTNAAFVRIVKNGPQIMVFWRSIFDTGPGPWNIGYSISGDNGESWTEPLYVLNPGWSHILHFSASASGPVVNIVVSRRISPDLVFFSIRSADFGESWSEPVEIFRAVMSSLTDQVSYNNMVHHAWGGFFDWDESGDVYYMRSTDGGISWSENTMLSEDDNETSRTPALCTQESGNVALSWLDFKYSPYLTTGDVLIRQSFDQGENWGLENQVTEEHRADVCDVAWATDTVYVVWKDWRFGLPTIYYVSSPDSIHDWCNKQRLEDDPEESEYPVLAVTNEKVSVIWADDRCNPDTDICGGLYFTRLDTEVGIEKGRDIVVPDNYSLEVYPNPFNSRIMISLNIQKGGETRIDLYDVNGRLVKSLFKGGNLEKGRHKYTWDATDANGKAVSSGLYFAVASTPQGKVSKALTLIR
jgi:hypothetical protein